MWAVPSGIPAGTPSLPKALLSADAAVGVRLAIVPSRWTTVRHSR